MKKSVSIRFYEELNDFLSPEKRKQEFKVAFENAPFIKDLIESLGVPPTAVDLILVNGQSVAFSYTVQNGDRISVYPVFETFDISQVAKLRARPLRDPKFILDTDLGELATYLENYGCDTLHRIDYTIPEIIHLSNTQQRTILTRNPQWPASQAVVRCYQVKQTAPEKQFYEVVHHFDLKQNRGPEPPA